MSFQFNNVLTASRMSTALSCWRKHFWQNEVGLRRIEETSAALRIGSAWARAMESRWLGQSYEESLAAAIPEGVVVFDGYTTGMISALLAGYYDYYGPREQFGKMHPEVQFSSDLGGGWTTQGKIDGLGSLRDGRSTIIESKTTSDSLESDSDYWLRLNFNIQVQQYVVESRELGWDISCAFYDVTKKPKLSPREQVDELDNDGRKQVLDAEGNRVYNARGKFKGEPKQSADKKKGERLLCHKETPDEYCTRIYEDVISRPQFYFCRKEIAITSDVEDELKRTRLLIRDSIEFYRSKEQGIVRDPSAWPRNVSTDTCGFCPYKNFCLTSRTIDFNYPPDGFAIQSFNPELEQQPKQ